MTVADAQREIAAVRSAARPAVVPHTPVSPGPIVVDSSGDQPDALAADGQCLTAAGTCTLRAAITEANAHAGPDTIAFAIPGSGVQTIQISSALPTISDRSGATTIDGYTQPGATPNTDPVADNAHLMVQIQGNGISVPLVALTVTSPNNMIRGLAIYNYRPIMITGVNANGNSVMGDFIGTDAAAQFAATVRSATPPASTWPAAPRAT